ncbi:MAG: alanine--tRNA ligase [Gammaproteobacteria bacterium]|nr:alanine--tRNA ligase [Gammaproteobacteria bacterium]
MKTADIRQAFLDYFRRHGHEVVPSSPLVPGNDPTLLFTNAGMVQFKEVFLGQDPRSYQRAATVQRCVRAGGKHNDLENVGYTARHHTFFEMLGNFSFGDYFKREAIHYAWELLTRDFGLPAEKLWVTVFEEDDEAADIWLKEIGVPDSRFARIGAHDNFWAMGDTGPCGPCSEIFYDHGPDVEGGPPGSPDQDGDRYVEIWNLVFMQYNREADGTMAPLPKPSVDTGMGLERLATVLQGVHSNYDIDLFRNLLEAARDITGAADPEDKSLRVLADHIRSTAFLIADGVLPANEGRGYVLRRIIRRAIRHGYRLGAKTPFFCDLVDPLESEMGAAHPALTAAKDQVVRVLKQEEERFAETLEQGMKILEQEIHGLSGGRIPGEVAFRLYDTYGFPVDLTADVARERGLEVDMDGFEKAMAAQREQARAASHFKSGDIVSGEVIESGGRTCFVGYDTLSDKGRITAISRDARAVREAGSGDEVVLVLDNTPFYAESGGQVGDRGELRTESGVIEVVDTRSLAKNVVGHIGRVVEGRVAVNDEVTARVDPERREDTMRNHSATHLLHAALKQVLGTHVQQKGSLVEAGRLRFDFSHQAPLTGDELLDIEDRVNEQVLKNLAVESRVMDLDEAKAAGAEALFGEKYDQQVRTIRMGGFSLELCGGTHVRRTGDIGLFKITQETGIAAGVRRIDAVTGQGALAYMRQQLEYLDETAALLRAQREEVPVRTRQVLDRVRQLEREKETLQGRIASGAGTELMDQVREVNGIKMLASRLDGADAKSLRQTIDRYRDRLGRAVVVLGSANEGKYKIVAGVSKSLSGNVHAGDLVKHLASVGNGRGGGRPDMAEGGVPDADALDRALAETESWLAEHLH